MLHIKFKWKKCRPSGVGFKGQILKLCRCKYIFIKLSTKTYLTGICDDLNNTEAGLQIYGGPGSLSHDFKIWPITFQGSWPSGPILFSCEKISFY